MKKFNWYFLAVLFTGCTTQQLNQTVGTVLGSTSETPTNYEVGQGLKEALIKGISEGADQASAIDGYFRNPRIKIPFPPEIQKAENTLRDIGLGSQVDRFVESMNRGAEKAALEAKPIFINAIKQLTIDDVWGILKGDQLAATQYLQRTTSDQLAAKFQPIIHNSLESVSATKYYSDLASAYNKVPFVTKIDTDLDQYVTDQAIEGLFYLIGQEEIKIRKNPAERTTALLKKEFSQQD